MSATASAPGLTGPPPPANERWRAIPRRWRIVLVVVAVAIGVELASSIVSGVTGNSSGASGPSSSFDSSASGVEAFAQLLSQRGDRVERLTVSMNAPGALGVHSTLFVLDPTSWNTADTEAVDRALGQGDRVVLGGRPPAAGVLRSLLGVAVAPTWRSSAAGVTHLVLDLSARSSGFEVVSPGAGTYELTSGSSPATRPLLRGAHGVLAFVDDQRGSLVVLASTSALQNGALARADNAAFGLDLAGPRGSVVVFDEYDHGFGRAGTGLAGLPASWRFGLGIALLAVLVWMVSAARRFGPPQEPDRVMVPARSGYVDAMATLLSTRPVDQVAQAVEPVRAEARRQLCRRVGIPADASPEVLTAALAQRVGTITLDDVLVQAVLRPPRTDADIVAVGNALAQLERKDPTS